MRTFYFILFWITLLFIFLLIPKNPKICKINEVFYLKEYFYRALLVMNETEKNSLIELLKRINNSKGCNVSIPLEIKKFYKFYKKGDLRAVFGIWIDTGEELPWEWNCSNYTVDFKCICYYDEFQNYIYNRPIEVKEAGFVTIKTNIKFGNLTIYRIGIGYYRK